MTEPKETGSPPPIRVLVVEDEERIRKTLVRLLQERHDIRITGAVASGPEAVTAALEGNVEVLLLDLGLPGLDGIEVTKKVKSARPEVEILIFTVFDDEDKVLEAIQAGAAGYLLKGASTNQIAEAICEVHAGGSVVQPKLARRLLNLFRGTGGTRKKEDNPLSHRETEILELIAKGLSNAEVADTLRISRSTVRTHLEHIYQKLDVTNRTEAVTEGIRKGLIDL